MMRTKDLTQGSIGKTLLMFSIPMILGNMLQQCYSITDTLLVGRYLGPEALATVGSSYALITFINSILIGATMGCGALFSHDVGAKNQEKLEKDVWNSFLLLLVLTLVLEITVLAFLKPILVFLHVPQPLLEESETYASIIFLGIVFVSLYNFSSCLLKAVGNAKVPLAFLAFSSFLNIALDILFITRLNRGIRGAAEATLLSQALAALGIFLFVLLYHRTGLPRKANRKYSSLSMKDILNYTSFTALQQSVMNFGILMVQGLVNSFGPLIMAAFASAVKIDTLAYMPAQEFANAYAIFVAQNHGAKKEDRIREGTRIAFLFSIGFCIAVAIFVTTTSKTLMGFFVAKEETVIIREGVRYLFVEGSFYWGIGCLFLFYAYFRGIGEPKISLLLTIVSLGTRVLLAYTFAPHFGVIAIWLAIPIGWVLADVTGLLKMKARKTGPSHK